MTSSTPIETQQISISVNAGNLTLNIRSTGIGPLVVFLHGFPDTYTTFDSQLLELRRHGYRAVSIGLPGYHPSSLLPDYDYSQANLANDLILVIHKLVEKYTPNSAYYLVGHDWGAAIAYTIAAFDPEHVRNLTAIALPHSGRFISEITKHPKQMKLSWYMLFFQMGVFADYAVRKDNHQFIRRLWRDWSPGWLLPEQHIRQVIESLSQPGVLKAALQYYRRAVNFTAFSSKGRQASLFEVPVPTLAISGDRDGCIDTDVFECMMHDVDFPKGLEFKRLEGVGHFPHLEQSDTVNHLLLEWLGRHG